MGKDAIFFDRDLNYKCKVFATAFKVSVTQYKYDSEHFVKTVMTDRKLDWLFTIDDCQDWCDGYFLMSVIDYREKFHKGKCADDYAMWWLGYLYKYWMKTRNMSRYEVYKILPFKRYMAEFEFLHTQGWEYVIEKVTRDYMTGNYIV